MGWPSTSEYWPWLIWIFMHLAVLLSSCNVLQSRPQGSESRHWWSTPGAVDFSQWFRRIPWRPPNKMWDQPRIWKNWDSDLDLPRQLPTCAYTQPFLPLLLLDFFNCFCSTHNFCWSKTPISVASHPKNHSSPGSPICFGQKSTKIQATSTWMVPRGSRRCVPRHPPVMPDPPVDAAGETWSQWCQWWWKMSWEHQIFYPLVN